MKKHIVGVLLVLLYCGTAGGRGNAPLLFCSGSREFSRSSAGFSDTCYNAQWLDTVISGEVPLDVLPENIAIQNYNADLIVRTDPASTILRYTIKGLPDTAVTIQKTVGTLSIVEQEIRPRNRQTGKQHDRVIASIEVIIPASAALQTVSIKSCIGSTELTLLSSDTLTVEADVNQITAHDVHCKHLNITASTAPIKLKKIVCSTCNISTVTGDTVIENIIATIAAFFEASTGGIRIRNGQLNNPSISAGGSFEFTGSCRGDIRLSSRTGKTDMDLQHSEAIGKFEIVCSTGDLCLKHFKADTLMLNLSTGNTQLENAAVISSVRIAASTGSVDCDMCTLHNAKITLGTGSFYFSGLLTGITRLSRSTGSINLNIHAPEDSYRVFFNSTDNECSTHGGVENIVINGQSPLITGNKNAEHTVHIQGGTGNCAIRFLEENTDKRR
ncbi:MAG: DUF4097 family beta strand repeat-containing protein [Treponema sp.]